MEPNTPLTDTSDTSDTTDTTNPTVSIETTDTTDKDQAKKPFLSYVILAVIALLIITFLYNRAKKDSSTAPTEQSAAPVSSSNPAIDATKDNALNNPSFDSYLNLGLMYYRTGQHQYCINATLKALEYPTSTDKQAMAYNNLCSAYNALSMPDEAIKACEKAISLSPDFQLAKNNLKVAMAAKKE